VNILIAAEDERFSDPPRARGAQSQAQESSPQQAQSSQTKSQSALADFIMHKLGEGAVSEDDLRLLVVKEGYSADSESATRPLHETLTTALKAGSIRQLPDGSFALPSVPDTIRLRRAS